MSPVETLRKYRVSLILDTRGLEEGIDALEARYRETLTNLGAEVAEATHERRDFIRVTDRNHPGDYYLIFEVQGPPETYTTLSTETRLDNTVKSVFVERLD